MTINDLKYINFVDIEAAHLNVTSAEMYEEAQNFNMHMSDMRRKRWRFLRDYWGIVLLNIAILAIGIGTSLSSYTSLLFSLTGGRGPIGTAVGGNITLTWLPALLYIVPFVHFILIRKLYNWRVILGISLLLIPVNYCFIVLAVFNAILTHTMYTIDEEIKNEIGYPHFVSLTLSYIRDEESAEEGDMEKFEEGEKSDDLETERKENPFDKYRTKWSESDGMLRDNDISNDTKEKNNG